MAVIWLDLPKSVLPLDDSLNFLNCLYNILINFQILKQGTHVDFVFHLSFQNLLEYQLIGSFFVIGRI